VYSDYEDSTVVGDLTIAGLRSCWLGMARVHLGGNANFANSKFADPDAIEILANHIRGDLVCVGNSMVWDSADISPTPGVLFPRLPEPNWVGGHRFGQCRLSSPTSQGGPLGPGLF
jgi:hypothetical protein